MRKNWAINYPIFDDESGDGWADDARNGPDGVGDAHQDGRVLGSDVQVVDGEPGPREAAAAQAQRDAGDCTALGGQQQRGQGHEDGLAQIRAARK